MGAPPLFVHATEDPATGRTLLKGRGLHLILDARAIPAEWSRKARGHVIATADLPDLLAWCQWRRVPHTYRKREGP